MDEKIVRIQTYLPGGLTEKILSQRDRIEGERKLELLLDGFQRAKSGKGQAFSIISEAGMGKSRLLYELRKAITNEDVTLPTAGSKNMRGNCLYCNWGRV